MIPHRQGRSGAKIRRRPGSMETPMRTSFPPPILSAGTIILGICTVVVLMGITRHDVSGVDRQAAYSSAGTNETVANAGALSPPG
jgi:hypothetical protein